MTHPPAGQLRPCPVCGKPATVADAPFCGRRCADVDLHRWLSGAYALPATEEEEDDPDRRPPGTPRDGEG